MANVKFASFTLEYKLKNNATHFITCDGKNLLSLGTLFNLFSNIDNFKYVLKQHEICTIILTIGGFWMQ